jgi:hypothetical protein
LKDGLSFGSHCQPVKINTQVNILIVNNQIIHINSIILIYEQGQRKAWRITLPKNLTLTLKINRVPDSLKDVPSLVKIH